MWGVGIFLPPTHFQEFSSPHYMVCLKHVPPSSLRLRCPQEALDLLHQHYDVYRHELSGSSLYNHPLWGNHPNQSIIWSQKNVKRPSLQECPMRFWPWTTSYQGQILGWNLNVTRAKKPSLQSWLRLHSLFWLISREWPRTVIYFQIFRTPVIA